MEAGRRLGQLLKPGDTVYLFGELGSGKTVFVKGIASALGIPEREITSASFTIVAEHLGQSGISLYHADLYRLENLEQAEAIGIEEYIGSDGIAVIEWADRLPPGYAEGIRVEIRRARVAGREGREIIIEGLDEKDWHNS